MKFASRLLGALLMISSACAFAQGEAATYFGSLPGATFGGNGIPNDSVVITQRSGLTLGLSASQRYDAAVVTNNGVDTFFAAPGVTTRPNGTSPGATWNFNFYINQMGEGGLGHRNLSYQLMYDFDPAANTSAANMGSLNPLLFSSSFDTAQSSQNLNFGWLAGNFLVTPPPGAFDPSVNGQYSFSLIAWDGADVYARADMKVQVGEAAAVPEPGALALMGLGMSGLALARRRRQQK